MADTQYMKKRRLLPGDLQNIAVASLPSLSFDNAYLAYVVSSVHLKDNCVRDYIKVIDISTNSEVISWEGTEPQWSPVSHELAYRAADLNQSYVALYSLDIKEHKHLVKIVESHYFLGHLSLKNFEWSPDGKQIAYITADARVHNDDPQTGIKLIDRLLYKTRGGRGRPDITDNALSHIGIISLSDRQTKIVTTSNFNDHSLSWSPDASRIAFISNRTADPDNNQLHDLWSINIQSEVISRHTENIGTAYQPSWSPDGKYIAFLATVDLVGTNDSPSYDTHIYLVSDTGDNSVCITAQLDRRVEKLIWHPSSDLIYFTAGDKGTISIYTVSVGTGSIEKLIGDECQVQDFKLDKSGNTIVYTSTGIDRPAEVFLYDQSGNITKQLSHLNDAHLKDIGLQTASSFWFKSFDETNIQAWLMKPALFESGVQYPLVLLIHGGPHNMFGYSFEEKVQLLAAEGFGVLFINPRGSSGYGQQFSFGCVNDWGGGDYRDLMAGVDSAIDQNEWIDPARLGVTGQSYGGYMTNWIVTQTNRFKVAVSDGGISNLISFAGTSLYHSLIESEFKGSAYKNFDKLWSCSPLKYVSKIITPTLLLHGEKDNEVPVSQAEEMYIAMKKHGVETTLVQYTGEGHGWRPDLAPLNKYDSLNRIILWIKKYING